MDYQIIFFCNLLKNVLHSNDDSCWESKIDWDYMVELAKAHNVLSIFVEGAIKYASYVKRFEYGQEMSQNLSIVLSQARKTEAFLELYKAFIDAEIHPIVMKGLICRQLYGDLCDHRPSGDEDILIRPSEYFKAKEVLMASGYRMVDDGELEEQIERLQEISFYNSTEKLHIELHLNPMGKENDARSRMSDCFKDVFDNSRDVEIGGVMIRTMSHQDHLLFLILHSFKHFTLGGFGIRQVLDILLYHKQYGTEIDLEQIRRTLKEFRADVFWNDLIHIGNKYLGFELSVFYPPNCPDELLEDMMQAGVFGSKTEAAVTAGRATMRASGEYLQNKKSSMFTMLGTSIFPSRQYMLDQAPYLQKKPWLLPVAWFKRWMRFAIKLLNKDADIATEGMKIASRRMKLFKKYDLM